MNKETLDPAGMKRYFELQDIIKQAEAELGEIKTTMMADFEEMGKTKQPTSKGTFFVVEKPIWRYSPKVEEGKQMLKVMMKDEEMKGIALCKITKYVSFKPNQK